jgi:hypothetical protein
VPVLKLIAQIPSYNDERALPLTPSALLREVPGIDRVEWLVDSVDHVVHFARHQGLATK